MNIQKSSDIFALQRENEELRSQINSLKQLLSKDAFTCTYNRSYFMDRLEVACQQSETDFSVLFVDVDGLKMINDEFGHAAGDEILLQVAHMLSAAINSDDVLARMGGDEFAILIHDAFLANSILGKMHNIDFQIDSLQLSISVSVGIANGQKGCLAKDILEQADKFMYLDKRAKIAGNDNF